MLSREAATLTLQVIYLANQPCGRVALLLSQRLFVEIILSQSKGSG